MGSPAPTTEPRLVNVYEAKTHLSQLLAEVEAGRSFVLARDGRPVARLSPIAPAPRRLGLARGEVHVGDDFDAPLPDDMLDGLAP
jgi:antitoxin (DNA-binding transcriptional repressor) of toxin-antitoxin stability system